MGTKTARKDIRFSQEEKEKIKLAAELARTNFSDFCRESALKSAELLVAEHTTEVVPLDFYMSFLSSIDEPEEAPGLANAVKRLRDSQIA